MFLLKIIQWICKSPEEEIRWERMEMHFICHVNPIFLEFLFCKYCYPTRREAPEDFVHSQKISFFLDHKQNELD